MRNRAHMLRTYEHSACSECDPFCQPQRQRWLLDWAARHGDAVFFSTMDLAEMVPGGRHLPLVIESERWRAISNHHRLEDLERRNGTDGPVVIGHAPTHRLIKGTHHVERAFESLRESYPQLQLRMMDNVSWEEVPAFLSHCDIVVDHLGMGWYGTVAAEAMATGRAVVLYLRDDLAKLMPDLPAVSANRETLASVLARLIEDPERRTDLGSKGQAFVRRHHDVRVVGRQLLEIYRRLLGD